MRRVLDRRCSPSARRAGWARRILEAAAFAGAFVAFSACGSHYGLKLSDYDVGAQVLDESRQPVPGVQVQVWIVDVDLPATERSPIAMNPVITTNEEGLAVWTFQSSAEPSICGYQVKNAAGETLVEELPNLRNDFGPTPSRVTIRLTS